MKVECFHLDIAETDVPEVHAVAKDVFEAQAVKNFVIGERLDKKLHCVLRKPTGVEVNFSKRLCNKAHHQDGVNV